MYKKIFKRLIDISIASIVLIIFAPLLCVVVVVLYFFNDGNVFFTQERPGFNQKIFKVLKFKTMNEQRDAEDKLLPDHLRLTPIGKFVRSTSLDEMPQLINVLMGDMSLVGPRPLLVKYLPLYSEKQNRRHSVRPGITGWAQVNGRNAISWEKKFELDVWYVENYNFLLDVKIIGLTMLKVLIKENVNSKKDITMSPFLGNKK
jgi:undecaprenyl phosphate N,N'-diacetylbacillosamine 1-phosphate transferase